MESDTKIFCSVKKQEVIDRLKSFFRKYYGVSGSFGTDEVKTTKYTDDIYDNPLYKVAYTAKGYGEKEGEQNLMLCQCFLL